MIHLVVAAASWGPKDVNYIRREKQKYVQICKKMWYLEESPLSQAEFCLDWDVTVEEKCEVTGHNRNKNKSDQKFITHYKERIK